MKYQGQFKPKNPEKYLGNPSNVVYRSGWELSVMFWCDTQESVIAWCSEDLQIPYLCPTDNLIHRYFVDFLIKFKNGKTVIVEVKPLAQTKPPVLKTKKPGKRYIRETFLYVKNQAKWKAATEYAQKKGWYFQVWTEHQLKDLGIQRHAKTV